MATTELFMSSNRQYTDELKSEAVKQVVERGFTVLHVSTRIGIYKHTLYSWVQSARQTAGSTIGKVAAPTSDSAEVRRLKAELKRVTEVRDILKNPRLGLRRFLSVEKHRRRVGVRQDCGRQLFGGLLTPSKNLVQGTLRIDLWRRLWRPRLGN